MKHAPIRETTNGVEVDLLVVPNASRAAVVAVHGDRVKIRVASPPEKNRANAAVIELLRNATGARSVDVLKGRTGRHKTVLLTGVTLASVRARLKAPRRK